MKVYAKLSKIEVGDEYPVRIMGVINVSPESFYKGSVKIDPKEIADTALQMVEEGVDIIDVGGMSTAPYLETEVSAEEEARRLSTAIKAIRDAVDVPISADTMRSEPAEAAIKAGAEIINDVSGLKNDKSLARLIADYGLSTILMANGKSSSGTRPIDKIRCLLKESLELALSAGIPEDRIAVDPGIGFFRKEKWPWYVWDCMVIRELKELRTLGRPICIAVSRKSFIGKILNQERPEDRLYGSLSATAIAVYNGAHVIRTHDVGPTLQAVRMAEALMKGGP